VDGVAHIQQYPVMYRAKLIPKIFVFECVISAALMFVLLRTHQQPKSHHLNILWAL